MSKSKAPSALVAGLLSANKNIQLAIKSYKNFQRGNCLHSVLKTFLAIQNDLMLLLLLNATAISIFPVKLGKSAAGYPIRIRKCKKKVK